MNSASTGTCEVLRGGLQDFSSPSASRRAPKKTRKRPVSKSVPSLLVNTRFTWEPQTVTVQSDTLAALTNHDFNALNSNAVKKSRRRHHEQQLSRDPTPVQPPIFWRTWSSDQSELTPLIWGCLSAECTRDPLNTFRVDLQRMCAQNDCALSGAFFSINDFSTSLT